MIYEIKLVGNHCMPNTGKTMQCPIITTHSSQADIYIQFLATTHLAAKNHRRKGQHAASQGLAQC